MVYGMVLRHSVELDIDSTLGRGASVLRDFSLRAAMRDPADRAVIPSAPHLHVELPAKTLSGQSCEVPARLQRLPQPLAAFLELL